jgi:glycosyltransferase involved in cell wall biosynthesis
MRIAPFAVPTQLSSKTVSSRADVFAHIAETKAAPAVSVVMPVFNAQQYLGSAIRSVLRQTFTDFEFIIVDDGSTDSSIRIMDTAARFDRRVRFIEGPHQGIVGALNLGLSKARGEFVARMDADDISLPDRLLRQIEFLRSHPDHVLVGSRVLLIDPDGSPICPFISETTHDEIDRAQVELRWPLVHPAVMMRREVLLQLGGYRPQYEGLEDTDLFLRLAEIGKLANLSDILLHYRQHHRSICALRTLEQNQIRAALHREMHQRRGIRIDRDEYAYHAPKRQRKEMQQQWSWQALLHGNARTARKYAFRMARDQPFDRETWRFMYCALRGY